MPPYFVCDRKLIGESWAYHHTAWPWQCPYKAWLPNQVIHHFYSETKDWNFGLSWTLFKYERSIDQKWHLFSRQKYDLILWGKKCPVWPHLVPAWLADPPSYNNDPLLLCLLLLLLSTSWPDTWLSLPSSTGDLDDFNKSAFNLSWTDLLNFYFDF